MGITILRMPKVKKITQLSRDAIYHSISRGDFPKPIKITPRSSGWLLHEVEQWIDKKIMERDLAILEAQELEEMCA